jgi:hypothetical protein
MVLNMTIQHNTVNFSLLKFFLCIFREGNCFITTKHVFGNNFEFFGDEMGLGIGWSFGIILGFVGKCTL